jgi:putative ABC transport system permease protein
MDALRQDLRYALRALRGAPGFTAIVLLTLALGIGANTAIFSVVNAVLLRPLPYQEPERLMLARETYGEGLVGTVSGPNFLDWRGETRSFERLAASRMRFLTAAGDGEPEEVAAAMVSADLFDLLGVPPVRGRGFVAGEDEGRGEVTVLSDGFWRARYGADPSVVGRQLTLGGRPYTIVGIAPPGMTYPGRAQVWVPLELGVERATDRSSHSYDVIGRLRPGVSLDQAQSEMEGIARELARVYPETNTGRGVTLVPLAADTVGAVRPALLLVAGAVAFVLLIACANVANLFLARASLRQRELAVRAALGAGRWRLVRQVLVEALLLAGAGGVLGLLLASWGVHLLLALQPRGIPRLQEIAIDTGPLLFTLLVSVLIGIGFGLFPALSLSSHDAADSFRGEGRGSSHGVHRVRFRRALVVAQVSLALILVTGAALLVVTVRRLTAIEPGFDPRNALTFQLSLPAARFPEQAGHSGFVDRVLTRLAGIRGAEAVGAVYHLPLGSGDVNGDFTVEGSAPAAAGREPYAGYRIVAGRYFEALGVARRQGRLFGPEDRAGSTPVAIINETLARQHFPRGDAIGRRLTLGDGEGETVWRKIVGVAADVRHLGLTREPTPEIYVPLAQLDPDLWDVFKGTALSVVVRAPGDAERLAGPLKSAVREIDAEQPVSQLRPMDELVSGAIARQRFSMILLLAFGGLALTLAAVGVYGVMVYSVTQRHRELGIRLALGARPAAVQVMVLRQGLGMALAGIALGLLGAMLLGRLLAGVLYGVTPTDPLVLAVVAALLGVASGTACLVPALRATRVNPVDALRSE